VSSALYNLEGDFGFFASQCQRAGSELEAEANAPSAGWF
jgi:hypothetical protein